MKRILVVSERNACRSLMAQGWLSYYGDSLAWVQSAGLQPARPDPMAIEVMADAVIDISSYTSKAISAVAHIQYHYIILLSNEIRIDDLPLQGNPEIYSIHFPDVAGTQPSYKEMRIRYSSLRDAIENYCIDFTHQNIRPLL